ncbi:amidohydrolase family protein [Novosphingobium sp. PASSN1]|uniref:amidohydrolase family protein n=1 Tax=Novosphingobium sp. PASSN1 TaxID=2015561 RepID=UPI0025CFA884|nr:amidohydrolase family protein [Novosphingobium sp. PASSN1]
MAQMNYAVPEELLPFVGDIIDVDTHESLPINHWQERYGSIVNDFANALTDAKFPVGLDLKEKDDTEINADTVWKNKRLAAPGAFDFERRLEVMNLTGVKQQIVFPGAMGLMAVYFHANAHNPNLMRTLSWAAEERRSYALKLIKAYNAWVGRTAGQSSRFQPVGILCGDTPDELISEAKRLIADGVRGLWMPSSTPPAGRSPAHPDLDPLWDALASAAVPIYAHVGADHGFLKTEIWREAPAFEGFRMGEEHSLDPWILSTNHRATENFLTTMIVGGVFERHPTLRYGAMETGGNWIGPLAEHLDMWINGSGIFLGSATRKPDLSLKPSEYIRRNVRVAPFGFEDVGHYISLYGMPEVYCYQSDFPHIEGGKNPMGDTVRSFARQGMGQEIMKMFYCENAKLLVPN